MNGFLEVWSDAGRDVASLEGDRVSLGKGTDNDVCISWDSTASRLHAVIEKYSSGWTIRDLGSRNGTFVNGQRITGERALRPGDEILIGETRLVFRTTRAGARETSSTQASHAPPDLTRREREVLISLCRPVLKGSFVTEASSLKGIAEDLVVSESAVKKHLGALYDKFGLADTAERKRGRLAGEAIRRGAVTTADL